ncbi:ABC transporter permease [Saccharomonospora sp. NPDC046836]|uniref:ABC transporter permease n=1 Tax=Saccharomonospora sp. NPDC046836 TaxID=3156921 RepID=UPI0033D0D2D6
MSLTTQRGISLRGRRAAGLSGLARNWLVFAGAVAVWELAARLAGSVFFPPPTQIVTTAVRLWFSGPASQLFLTDTVFEDVLPSLGRCLGGWAIAVALGITLGTALGRSRTGMDYVGPLFAFFRAIPPPTLVPVFLVLFGLGPGMQVATIIFGAVWPVLLNTVDGVRSVDAVKVDTARSFRTPRRYWIGLVVLPAALPKIFAGLRLSLSISLILMVVSELIGSFNGIGYRLITSQQQFDFPLMWSWIVLLGILGYGLNTALLTVERRLLGWQPTRNDDV